MASVSSVLSSTSMFLFGVTSLLVFVVSPRIIQLMSLSVDHIASLQWLSLLLFVFATSGGFVAILLKLSMILEQNKKILEQNKKKD